MIERERERKSGLYNILVGQNTVDNSGCLYSVMRHYQNEISESDHRIDI